MSEALICPDCGGMVGGDIPDGVRRCSCFDSKSFTARVDDEDPVATIDSPEPEKTDKICYVCNESVAGKKRYKDKDGYICQPCAKAQEQLDRDLVSCAECGKRLKPAGLVNYRGSLICKRCDFDHKEMDKVKVDKVNLINYEVRDKEQLKKLLIAASVLGLLVLISIWRLTRS